MWSRTTPRPLPLEPPRLHGDTPGGKMGSCGVPLGRLVGAEALGVPPLSPLCRVEAGPLRPLSGERTAWSRPPSAGTRLSSPLRRQPSYRLWTLCPGLLQGRAAPRRLQGIWLGVSAGGWGEGEWQGCEWDLHEGRWARVGVALVCVRGLWGDPRSLLRAKHDTHISNRTVPRARAPVPRRRGRGCGQALLARPGRDAAHPGSGGLRPPSNPRRQRLPCCGSEGCYFRRSGMSGPPRTQGSRLGALPGESEDSAGEGMPC